MKTLPLGNTGVQVSAMCMGTIYLGAREDRATSCRLMDRYVDAGGSFFDTANIYSWWLPGCAGGECETILGEWMRERRNRSQVFIASKVGFQYPGVERGLTRARIEAECDKSLRRMGIDTIDLYYSHVDDPNTPMEETMAAFLRSNPVALPVFAASTDEQLRENLGALDVALTDEQMSRLDEAAG